MYRSQNPASVIILSGGRDMNMQLEVQTVSRAAYESLYRMILAGQFVPGQWIKEREVSEMLGISRTPIREALRMLERERVVVSIPHRGFRVPIPTAKELQDFYELRAELEGMGARLASERATDSDIQALTDLWTSAQSSLLAHDVTTMAERNDEFHRYMATCTDNGELVASLVRLRAGIDLYRNLSWTQKSRPARTLEQHQQILFCITNRNGLAAQESARVHIMDSLAVALQGLETFQSHSGPR
jgi:DNA-binding GntR family transcriptional regulator